MKDFRSSCSSKDSALFELFSVCILAYHHIIKYNDNKNRRGEDETNLIQYNAYYNAFLMNPLPNFVIEVKSFIIFVLLLVIVDKNLRNARAADQQRIPPIYSRIESRFRINIR